MNPRTFDEELRVVQEASSILARWSVGTSSPHEKRRDVPIRVLDWRDAHWVFHATGKNQYRDSLLLYVSQEDAERGCEPGGHGSRDDGYADPVIDFKYPVLFGITGTTALFIVHAHDARAYLSLVALDTEKWVPWTISSETDVIRESVRRLQFANLDKMRGVLEGFLASFPPGLVQQVMFSTLGSPRRRRDYDAYDEYSGRESPVRRVSFDTWGPGDLLESMDAYRLLLQLTTHPDSHAAWSASHPDDPTERLRNLVRKAALYERVLDRPLGLNPETVTLASLMIPERVLSPFRIPYPEIPPGDPRR